MVLQEKLKEDQKEKRRGQRNRSVFLFGDSSTIDKSENPIAIEIIEAGYRKMAQKYHPDSGGDTVKMKDLNRIKEKLLNDLCD